MSVRALLKPLRRTIVGDRLARSPLRPMYWRPSLEAAKTLWFTYGHVKSVRASSAIDGRGDAVPWYTYPAIEYLKQFDFSASSVFEYGSGNSTMFWGQRAARVVSVEDEEAWYENVRQRVPANCTVVHEADLREYPHVINRFPDRFDIIVVDGPARGFTRLKCARAAFERLAPGGLVILDNSDWLPESARFLRESDLLQVDMSGFTPIATQTQTTSFFFHRECRLRPRDGRQPHLSAGGVAKDWETRITVPGPSIDWDGETISGVVLDQAITKVSPGGPRRFRLVARELRPGQPDIAVLDLDLGRILVGPYEVPPGSKCGEEAARLDAMTWDAFRSFVTSHDLRRYVLEPTLPGAPAGQLTA